MFHCRKSIIPWEIKGCIENKIERVRLIFPDLFNVQCIYCQMNSYVSIYTYSYMNTFSLLILIPYYDTYYLLFFYPPSIKPILNYFCDFSFSSSTCFKHRDHPVVMYNTTLVLPQYLVLETYPPPLKHQLNNFCYFVPHLSIISHARVISRQFKAQTPPISVR